MNKFFDLIKETLKGKSILRILTNWEIKKYCQGLNGVIIDLGAGENPSYQRYWEIKPSQFIRVDIDPTKKPDLVADLNNPLPFEDNFADVVFVFNVLYILREPEKFLKEVFRILKPNGKLFLTSPFIFNEAREPHDYFRFTSEGLEELLKNAGFEQYQIIPIGERFSAACYLIDKIFIFNFLKIPFRFLALFFDKIWPKKLKRLHPCPIGYFVEAKK